MHTLCLLPLPTACSSWVEMVYISDTSYQVTKNKSWKCLLSTCSSCGMYGCGSSVTFYAFSSSNNKASQQKVDSLLVHMQLLWHLSQPASSPLSPHLALLPGICPGLGPPRIGMLLHDSAVEELQHAPLIQDVLNHK
jgi:hypothetical protein